MTCARCGGLMYKEPVFTRARARLLLWACFACGERMDDTIYFHRQMSRRESSAARHERILRELRQACDLAETV